MKNLFSLLFSLLFSASLTAQTIKWGAEHATEERFAPSRILGTDATGFYVLEMDIKLFGKPNYFLEYYNNSLNQSKKIELELKQGDGDKVIQDFYMSRAGNLWFLSSYNNKSQDKNYFFAQTIDKKLLKPKSDLKKLVEMPENNTSFSFSLRRSSKDRTGSFDIERSSDSSKILVSAVFPSKKSDETSQFSLNVFSDEMEAMWAKRIALPYKAELFDMEGFNVDNQGRVLVLGKLYEKSRKERKDKAANYKYVMLRFADGAEKHDILELNLDGKFVTDIKITSQVDGNYICAGMYSNKGSEANGCFFAEMDGKTGATLKKNVKEFSADFITQGMSDKRKKKTLERLKNNKETGALTSFDIKDLIRREDGGCVIVAEQFWIETYQYYDGKTWRTRNVYHNEDIITVNIAPSGVIDWATKIPKWQITSGGALMFFSYALAVVGDKIHIIYNEDKDNVAATKESELDAYSGERNSIALLVTVDAAGKVKRKELFNNKEEEITSVPKVAVQVGKNQLILLGKKKKDQKFCRITF